MRAQKTIRTGMLPVLFIFLLSVSGCCFGFLHHCETEEERSDNNVNGGGYIDSREDLTKDNASCTISGSYNKAWNDGQVKTSTFGPFTINFAVAG